jgi:polysaccharide export outer membrane protein
MRKRFRIMTLLIFILLICSAHSYAVDYVIGEGDMLFVSVWKNEALSVEARVRPDGKITIPALGEVVAANKTPSQLQEHLTRIMTRLVKKPVVSIIVQEISNNKVYVFGGGVKPGIYNLSRKTTLLQLLCEIQEVKNADLKKSYLLRGGKKVKMNFYKLFMEGYVEEDIVMQPDDVIFFPSHEDKNIYVVGAVNEPRFIEYKEGITVMEAILAAGGFTKFASKNRTVIHRNRGENEITIAVKLNDLINDGDVSQNVKLNPGDYIVISESIF